MVLNLVIGRESEHSSSRIVWGFLRRLVEGKGLGG